MFYSCHNFWFYTPFVHVFAHFSNFLRIFVCFCAFIARIFRATISGSTFCLSKFFKSFLQLWSWKVWNSVNGCYDCQITWTYGQALSAHELDCTNVGHQWTQIKSNGTSNAVFFYLLSSIRVCSSMTSAYFGPFIRVYQVISSYTDWH